MPAAPSASPFPLRCLRAGVLGVWCVLAWAAAAAQTLTVSCPMRVQSQRATLAQEVPDGFRVALQAGSLAWLTGVAMYDGAPQEGRLIESRTRGSDVFWTLEGQTQVPVLVCRYEGGIALGRQLPGRLRQCAAAVVRGKPDAMAIGMPERTVIQCL